MQIIIFSRKEVIKVTLKVNWKTTNRGLWLAGIAIIIVVISIMIDDSRFKNEKEEIANTVYDFADEVEKALLSPEGITTGKEEWTDEKIEEEKNEILDIYNKYWTKTSVNSYLEPYAGIGEYSDEVKQMLKEMEMNKGYISNVKLDLGTLTIKQYGPGGAVVTGDVNVDISFLNVDTIVYGLGSTTDLMYEDMDYENSYMDDVMYGDVVEKEYPDDETQEDGEDDAIHGEYKDQDNGMGYSSEVTIVLFREDGEWKISGISLY